MGFLDELNKRFKDTVKDIEQMEANGPEIFKHTLNDQQKLTIKTLKEREVLRRPLFILETLFGYMNIKRKAKF